MYFISLLFITSARLSSPLCGFVGRPMFRFGWVAHERVPFDIVGWVANDNGLDQSDITGRELGWVAPIMALPPAARGPHPPTALPSIAPKPHKARCSRTPKP